MSPHALQARPGSFPALFDAFLAWLDSARQESRGPGRFGSPPANTFIWFDYGEVEMMKNALTRNFQVNWKMRLYKNDYTPVPTDTGSGITEANFDSYTATTIGAWGSVTTVAGVAQSTAGQQTFAAGSSVATPNTIYGWYMTNTADADTVLGACRLVNSVLVNTPLQQILITPTLTGRTLGS